MRLPLNTSALLAATLSLSSAFAAESAPTIAKLGQSVYGVRTYGANEAPLAGGSAVVVGPGLLATACNVLAGAHTIAVRRDNISYGATLEAPDVERNLCLLRVENFTAPAVAIAASVPGFGQKAYAAAVSDGRTLALREAQVTGLQAGPDGKLDRIQLSLEADPAAAGRDSGGGLFDEQGRLLGIVSAPAAGDRRLRALPAAWIGEARTRGAAAMANYQKTAATAAAAPTAVAAAAPAAPAAAVAAETAGPTSPRVGERWIYTLTDKLTNKQTPITLRVDRIEGDRVIFNQGARLERKDGRLERIETPMAGEFDLASPPGGWVPPGARVGARWKTSFKQASSGVRTEFTATVGSETTVRVPAGSYRALRVTFDGYIQRPFYGFNAESGSTTSVPYTAVAWYAPELGRIVRFEARFASKLESRHEVLELSEHRFD
ncbi:serine protease [Cupriavidus respiraculi]|uniref:S1 family peptidase n=1 Tax=Cupriavidus respiraculi TaxID=195930 RepID=UPI001C9523F6|nr:serine protease [Cupriavidus respiraculi]MBY4948457.1 serine protease [Cupriavidus respiraculi]